LGSPQERRGFSELAAGGLFRVLEGDFDDQKIDRNQSSFSADQQNLFP
jgi:hypothetical protein